MNKINDFICYIKKKKKNFLESIDLNIVFINKNKKKISGEGFFYYSPNEFTKILLLSREEKKYNNIYYGIKYFFKEKFDKIFFNKENIYLAKKYLNNFLKKNIINNYDTFIKNFFFKKININILKYNYLNIKLANTNFSEDMIIKNYFFFINNLKKNFLIKNNIFIEKIYISSTMSKSFLLK